MNIIDEYRGTGESEKGECQITGEGNGTPRGGKPQFLCLSVEKIRVAGSLWLVEVKEIVCSDRFVAIR